MKCLHLNNITSDGYAFLYEGEFEVNDFSLKAQYGRDEGSPDSFITVSTSNDDNRYICFQDEQINKYWDIISNYFKDLGFAEDEFLGDCTKVIKGISMDMKEQVESMFNMLWINNLDGELKKFDRDNNQEME